LLAGSLPQPQPHKQTKASNPSPLASAHPARKLKANGLFFILLFPTPKKGKFNEKVFHI